MNTFAFATPEAPAVDFAVMGLTQGLGGPYRDMTIKKAAPEGAIGRAFGTEYAGLDAGFVIAPLMFGWFMDRGSLAGSVGFLRHPGF